MRTALRVSCALLVLALSFVLVAGAGAGPAVTASVGAPDDGSVLSGAVVVRGSAHAAAGVKRVEISIDGFGVVSKQPATLQQDASAEYSWDSDVGVDSSSVVANGSHTITVHAVATGGADDSASIEVQTNNPPAVPAGLTVAEASGVIDVGWDANSEPDLLGYVVERDSGSGYVVVGRVDEPSFRETLVAGTYSYRVTALRSSPVTDDGIASAPTDPVSTTVASTASGGSGSVTKLTGKHSLGGGHGLGRTAVSRSSLSALLSGRALPNAGALPAIPSPAGIDWGSYDQDLPYGEQPGAVPPELRARATSASGSLSLVPPDGLRWVAAGLLLLVCAGLTQLVAALDVPAPAVLTRGRRAIARWFTRADPRTWRP